MLSQGCSFKILQLGGSSGFELDSSSMMLFFSSLVQDSSLLVVSSLIIFLANSSNIIYFLSLTPFYCGVIRAKNDLFHYQCNNYQTTIFKLTSMSMFAFYRNYFDTFCVLINLRKVFKSGTILIFC